MDRKCNIIADNGCEQKIADIKPKITEENLINISNKGIYKRGVKDAENIAEAEISCSDEFIFISFADVKISVKADFKGVSCSCQSKTVCRHVITAFKILEEYEVNADISTTTEEILPDKEEEKKIETEKSEDTETSIQINKSYIMEVMTFMESVMKKGIINCNESDIDTAVQLCLKGENTVHNNISLMLRGFSADIKNMNEKNSAFISVNTFHLISKIYNTTKSIISCENSQEQLKNLCVSDDSKYKEVGIMHFIGLGAYPWSTKSGYTGITALLYCSNDKKIYTYSSSLAYIHEKTKNADDIESLSRTFRSHSHWQNLTSLMQISCSSFKLFKCKVNNLGRISSSKETVMNNEGFTDFEQLVESNLSAQRLLDEVDEYNYFSDRKSEKVCIIYAKQFENIYYDKAEQILKFGFSDGENIYPCELKWTEQNKNAVSYIETLAKRGIGSDGKVFVCRYIDGIFIPISAYDGEKIDSFYFE